MVLFFFFNFGAPFSRCNSSHSYRQFERDIQGNVIRLMMTERRQLSHCPLHDADSHLSVWFFHCIYNICAENRAIKLHK